MTHLPGCSPHLLSHWRTLPDAQLRITVEGARVSVMAFTRVTEEAGSLIQSWVQGRQVVDMDHYPPDDIVDHTSGSQFYYHCHRANGADGADGADGAEHGHLHLFWHATRSGRRRRAPAGTRHWVKTDPTHLFSISLDARGLPRALFTVNRWVTEGHWFDAASLLGLVDRFAMRPIEGHENSCEWITSFVRMYRPVIAQLLQRRDRLLARRGDLGSTLSDPALEVLSQIEIDWGADLDALEAEFVGREKPGPPFHFHACADAGP